MIDVAGTNRVTTFAVAAGVGSTAAIGKMRSARRRILHGSGIIE